MAIADRAPQCKRGDEENQTEDQGTAFAGKYNPRPLVDPDSPTLGER